MYRFKLSILHTVHQELRVQDYQQGRKTAPAAAATGFGGGFGQSTTTPAFGASGGTAFGQSGNTSGGGLFGSRPAGTPGGATGGGLFGSAGANTGAGAFGKPATPAFGQTATGTTGGGLFGQPAQNQGAAAGGAFGAPGATAGASGFGGFGQAQQQNKPAFSFGGGLFLQLLIKSIFEILTFRLLLRYSHSGATVWRRSFRTDKYYYPSFRTVSCSTALWLQFRTE